MAGNTSGSATSRLGNWLPSDPDALQTWLEELTRDAESRKAETPRHAVVREFQALIHREPMVRMYLSEMIEQVSRDVADGSNPLTSLDQLLLLIDEVLSRAPDFDATGLVSTPLSAILDRAMGTSAGLAAFRSDAINAMLQKILRAWCDFLNSSKSLYVLNDTPRGWMCAEARDALKIEEYQYDPRDAHWGFASWNDFFTRRFKKGARPVAERDNDKVIVSACEATPYRISADVKEEDMFWIKSQPYSLRDMLGDDEVAHRFAGGTVYQAYLSPVNYHRWHSPVSGRIAQGFVKAGTYFSEVNAVGTDPSGSQESQGYQAHTATRAIIHIEADDPAIGLMCAVFVGMGEVSSCIIDREVVPGHHVKKGDELGHFQFGGSSYCLVFGPDVIADFSLAALPGARSPDAALVTVNAKIATAH